MFYWGEFGSPHRFLCAGQLVWRRHTTLPPPSRHDVRNTCMQLLPIVEMYCRWELEKDCTDLHSLMLRFDSEEELESHELGRSLLYMVREVDPEFDSFPVHARTIQCANPFEDIRRRLAAVDVAIHGLHAQVLQVLDLCCICEQRHSLETTRDIVYHKEWLC